jgi:hypothetical protein
MTKKDLVVITWPPLSDFSEAPKDQSASDIRECPLCDDKMWLSERKKGLIMFAACANQDILLACYNCIIKKAQENPSFFKGSERVNI